MVLSLVVPVVLLTRSVPLLWAVSGCAVRCCARTALVTGVRRDSFYVGVGLAMGAGIVGVFLAVALLVGSLSGPPSAVSSTRAVGAGSTSEASDSRPTPADVISLNHWDPGNYLSHYTAPLPRSGLGDPAARVRSLPWDPGNYLSLWGSPGSSARSPVLALDPSMPWDPGKYLELYTR